MDLTQQLHRAIHAGLLTDVQRLIKEGAKMDHVLGMRGTALCAAIEARNLEIAEYLVQVGCDINGQDYDGEPPLLLALRKESPGQILGRKPSLDIAKLFIDNPTCNVNVYDKLTKKTALHFVAEQGMVEVAEWLMNAACKCDVNTVDKNGNSPLHLAVHDGHFNVIDVLVSNPTCQLKIYNNAGLTPLHICSNNGDIRSLEVLIARLLKTSKESLLLEHETGKTYESELSINLNAVTIFEKETCLHLACRNYHVDIVRALLNNGAEVNCKNNISNTALLLSLVSTKHWQSNDNEIVGLLLRKGANPNICASVRCRFISGNPTVTPLIVAAINDNIELVKLLIQHGADVNKSDDFGQTALYHALWENAQEVAVYLVHECPGINVNTVTADGSTCLHAVFKYCALQHQEKQRQMVKDLLAAGAIVVRDKQGKTPINYAFEYENHHALDALLEGTKTSADSLVYGSDCINMLPVAVTDGCFDIVKVLLSHGADINQRLALLDTSQSMLYMALYNREYKIAEHLVENGIDLTQEDYIFKDETVKQKVLNKSSAENREILTDDEDDTEDSESDSSGSDCDSDSENFDIFRGNKTLKKMLQKIATSPRTLQLSCLVRIRAYLRENDVPFCDIEHLPLPPALRKRLRYK